MSRYKYRFTLHQVYVYFAQNGDLNWRKVADAARVSTRTLRSYFGSSAELENKLVEYHLSYLENYYTKSRVAASPDQQQQFRMVRAVVKRHKPCYLFTEQAYKTNLADQGDKVKETHLNYIRNAMIYGGVKKDKVRPDMVFDFFLSNLPEGKEGEDLMLHWMRWFMT